MSRNYPRRMERGRIQLYLLDEAEKGMTDVAVGRTRDARQFLRKLESAHAARHAPPRVRAKAAQ